MLEKESDDKDEKMKIELTLSSSDRVETWTKIWTCSDGLDLALVWLKILFALLDLTRTCHHFPFHISYIHLQCTSRIYFLFF